MRDWNDGAIQAIFIAVIVILCAVLGVSSYTKGVTDTIKEAQRSAVVAGAARWSSNRETGEAQFDYIQCVTPAGLK